MAYDGEHGRTSSFCGVDRRQPRLSPSCRALDSARRELALGKTRRDLGDVPQACGALAAEIAVRRLQEYDTMSQRAAVPAIRFDATLYTIDKSTILRLPEKASGKLPSRGQVAVQGTINGHGFQTVLEPDGDMGHWMKIDRKLQQAAAVSAGDAATLEVEPLKDWPEPNVPQDLEAALAAAPRRSKSCGKASRRWRAGNGFAGSMQPVTLIRANDGSR